MREESKQLLSELNVETSRIREAFEDLFDPALNIFPIPFFGDIHTAKVLTVGLNPSDGEVRGRGWPIKPDTSTLYDRLTRYFTNTRFPPHPWFDAWEEALGKIGVSYTVGTAAHIDICPWPTRPMSSHTNQDRFTALIARSLPHFWRCIRFAENLRLVLMAGAVNKKYYLNEFLSKAGNSSERALVGKVPRNGKAFVGYQMLWAADKEFPVFFCSVSPSSRSSRMLPVRVCENSGRLMEYLT